MGDSGGVELEALHRLETEEAFDISIPDDRASRMLTVCDVYDFIIEKTADSTLTSGTCLTAIAFYELRRQLRSFGLADSGFRPKTRLDRSSLSNLVLKEVP